MRLSAETLERLGQLFVGDLKLLDQLRVRLRKPGSRRMSPQPVEIVELAHRLIEYVYDYVGKIHQHPVSSLRALHGIGLYAELDRILFQALRDTLYLTVGTARTDDEVIGDGCELVNIHHHQVTRFFFKGEPRQEQNLIPGGGFFQSYYRSLRRPS